MNFPTFSNSCPTDEVLLDYTSGCLEPAKAARFERHADGCARCGALRTAQAAIWRSLDEWKPAPASAGFNRELWRRIDAEQTSSWRRQWSRGWEDVMQFSLWKRVAPLAVAMALVVTAFVMDHSATAPVKSHTGAAVVVTVGEADQIERALDDMQLLDEADAVQTPANPGSNLM